MNKKIIEKNITLTIGELSDISGSRYGSSHDHGTGFRVFPNQLDLCF